MNRKKLSIIIPVYNTEESILTECIKSLENNYFDNEIIIIDDGSKDPLSKHYKKIAIANNGVYKKQQNMGVSYARNQGLKMANSELIMFMDSDDFVDKDFFKHAISGLEIPEVSIYMARKKILKKTGYKELPFGKHGIIVMNEENANEIALNNIDYAVSGTIFRKKILNGILFNTELQVGEDTLFFAKAFQNGNVYFSSNADYYYRKTAKSSITEQRGINAAIEYYRQNFIFCSELSDVLGLKDEIQNTLIAKKRYESIRRIAMHGAKYNDYRRIAGANKKRIKFSRLAIIRCNFLKKVLIYISANVPSEISYVIMKIISILE